MDLRLSPRSGRDRAEIGPRSRRDRAEIAPRLSRDLPEQARFLFVMLRLMELRNRWLCTKASKVKAKGKGRAA